MRVESGSVIHPLLLVLLLGVQLEMKSYHGFCATIQKRGHRPALFPPSNPAPPQSPKPKTPPQSSHLSAVTNPQKFQSSETNGPHARPLIPGAMYIKHSKPSSYPGLDHAKILYAGIPSSVLRTACPKRQTSPTSVPCLPARMPLDRDGALHGN